MQFLVLLASSGIAPLDVALCLHKPSDPVARQALLNLVEEEPALFEAYQSTHTQRAEATVRTRPYFASFIMTAPAEQTFVGLYTREAGPPLTADAMLANPDLREMFQRVEGHRSTPEAKAREVLGRLHFMLTPSEALASLRRRLIVADPGGRAYVRLADTTALDVLEIKRIASVTPLMPAWDALALTATDLRTLPRDWGLRLAEWRGVYLITDESDGARYVGSAYGRENLLGRWRSHIAGPKGVTDELRLRDTVNFRFSILDLLAPTADVDEITRKEHVWMNRLHTKRFGLNT